MRALPGRNRACSNGLHPLVYGLPPSRAPDGAINWVYDTQYGMPSAVDAVHSAKHARGCLGDVQSPLLRGCVFPGREDEPVLATRLCLCGK